jgi:2-succinyl-5-enolpyruvyl-6-hydroxy-3-cyclohexene-1-carboxylate synthase
MGKQLSSHTVVKLLADICVEKGVRKVVISAGSRNAPLIITFSRKKEFECYSITDERSAAFFALGMAERLGEPVGLICTSGTALLNYSPAVAEAYYKGIPLLVMSADRPIERIDQGDGQMIRQEGALANISKYSCSLPRIEDDEDLWHAKCLLEKSFKTMSEDKRGPVHVNVPLREPLYGTKDYNSLYTFTQLYSSEKRLSEKDIAHLSERFNSYGKILLIPAVTGIDKCLSEALSKLSELPQVVVLTETINNLKGENYFSGVDKFLSSINNSEDKSLYPDLVITLGDIIISRKIKQFLKNDLIKDHWHINPSGNYIDLFQKITSLIEVEPDYLLSNLALKPFKGSQYKDNWEKRKKCIDIKHDSYVGNSSWSDLKAFSVIKEYIPSDIDLHLGNSTVVRYAQLFDEYSQVNCFCNRGTSGIDGCMSTAVGSSVVSENSTLVITGDLSFYYDSNALWNKYISNRLKIILINNEGGGIFRFIEGPSGHNELTEFFENHQLRNAESIARAYGLDYNYCESEEVLREILADFFNADCPSILEIKTPREKNDKILRDYFKNFK